MASFEKPVRFIFSHSALREGCDNPNVFVICMLKHSDNTISRRQEVGRGLRLSVNQNGDRMNHPATPISPARALPKLSGVLTLLFSGNSWKILNILLLKQLARSKSKRRRKSNAHGNSLRRSISGLNRIRSKAATTIGGYIPFHELEMQ
jgi:type III restriction enzyme